MKETYNGSPVKREGKARADWTMDKTKVRASSNWREQPRKRNSKCFVCYDPSIITSRTKEEQRVANL